MNKVILILFAGILISCATSEKTTGSTASTTPSEDSRQYITLMDYLRGQPGIQLHRDFVTIRGTKTFNADQEPLYVINGNIIGNSYQQINRMIDVNDIESVRVLRDVSSTSSYGMRGSNGVIIIKTKDSGND